MTRDKQYHVGAGLMIGLVFGILMPWLGLFMAVLAGTAKEIYDRVQNEKNDPDTNTVEVYDIFATILGGVMAEVILAVFR